MVSLALALLLAAGDLELASPFGEHMVLQRRQPIPVWGWGGPGKNVSVKVAGVSASAVVGKDGRWRCDLPALEAGGPHAFVVTDGEKTVTFKDVLVGEVWICCGQSNMQMGYGGIPDIKELVKKTVEAGRPVRTLQVTRMISFKEEERCHGVKWSLGPPSSAVAASFLCRLQPEIDIPVAAVMACWGSSSIEGWMPMELAGELPHFKKMMEKELGGDKRILCEDLIRNYKGRFLYSKDPKVVAILKPVKNKYILSGDIFARTRPNLLYNAMLHPLIPMACRGMVYYQGEANATNKGSMIQYGVTQPLWLKLLRKRWGRDDVHFLNVMLPGFGRGADLESVTATTWALFRESQSRILELPHTALVNTVDLGHPTNIHPKDKMPIGERLALLARRDTCGEKELLACGPRLKGLARKGGKVIVSYTDARGLKTLDGKPPQAFWVSADGASWKRAGAEISGETVILTAPEGMKPAQVRYAYAAKPAVNLVNASGLPAYPFNAKIP